MGNNAFVPNYAGKRYRSSGLLQRPRRGEVQGTPTSYAVGSRTLPTPDGAPDAPWITGGDDETDPVGTRHGFPFTPIEPESLRNPLSTWDFPLNAHSMTPQMVADSGGLGATDPRAAGLDLMARIWSVKTWSLSGTILDVEISDTVAAGNALATVISDDGTDREETLLGAESGRAFVPVFVSWSYDVFEGETRTQVAFQMLLPGPSSIDSGGDFWKNPNPYIGAGNTGAGLTICPVMTGSLRWVKSETGSGGSVLANGYVIFNVAKQNPAVYTEVESQVKVCGYTLNGYRQILGAVGGLDGSLELSASEFWAADEWPG